MTIYSLYIFDRHCICVYYQDWHRTKRPKPAAKDGLLPAVSRAVSYQPPVAGGDAAASAYNSPRNTLQPSSGIVVALNEDVAVEKGQMSALAFDEEAKLVYGVILSLRNMVKKLSKRDEAFTAYRTSTYKLHLYETPTGYKFVLLTDPRADSSAASSAAGGAGSGVPVRFALRQLYAGPFLDYVVRNPLVPMDSRERGLDSDYFRASVDRLVRGLAIFQ